MKTSAFLLFLLTMTSAMFGAEETLFNGKDLTGWEGDTKVWRVEEGLIVGGSMAGNPHNEFLATTKSYKDFDFKCEYKLVGTEGFVNSGVQFWSVRMKKPAYEMSGYQADIGAGYSGCLYDESRRKKTLVHADVDLIKKIEKPGDWNQYRVRAEGRHIQIFLNGEKTVDYTEEDKSIPQEGLIALQIHGKNKAVVYFRNIVIEELSEAKPADQKAADPKAAEPKAVAPATSAQHAVAERRPSKPGQTNAS